MQGAGCGLGEVCIDIKGFGRLRDDGWHWLGLLSNRSLSKSTLRENRCNVVNVKTVTHTGAGACRDGGDAPIAVIVAWCGVMQHAERNHLVAIHAKLDDLVAVLCFSAVSIVHTC